MPSRPDQHHAASKGAQFLSEVLRLHAPVAAEAGAEAHRRITDEWLEKLEEHATTVVGPLIKQILDGSDPPPEVAHLLNQANVPSAQFGATIQQFFVFGLMFTLAQAMLAPFVQQVQNDVWSAHQDRPLSPPDAATAVVRGIGAGDSAGVTVPDWAIAEAAKSGITAENFKTMVGVSGLAPSLQLLFEAIRRQIIDEAQLIEGIKESDIKDKWIPFVAKLRYVQPSPTDFVAAAVQQQMPYDEASMWATTVGLEPAGYLDGNPDWFKLLYDVHGRPPGPVEMGHAANRGFIPWQGVGPDALTFQQAIAESDIKTKWTPILEKLAQYFPPNEEVSNLLKRGGLTKDQAVRLWQQNGVPTDLANAYAHIAEVEQLTQERALAKGEIETLLQEQFIDSTQAKELLAQVGYSGENADHLIAMAEFRYELSALRNLIRRTSTLFTNHKITTAQLKQALQEIGLSSTQIDGLIDTLTVQRDTNVARPTAAQVETAFNYQVIDQPTAIAMLESLGYDAWSAWFVLSAREHGPIPNEPPRPPYLLELG